MMIKDRVVLAPMDAERSPVGEHTMSSWEEHLTEAGLDVVHFKFLGSSRAAEALGGARAIVVPSSPIDIGGEEPVGMGHETMYALRATLNQPMEIFSERPIEDNFSSLRNRFPGDQEVKSFDQLVHELCETVIGQDVSIIQRKLGVR